MEKFLEAVKTVNDAVNGAVWGLPGLILLIGTGILLTFCTKVFQISHLGHWWKNTIVSIFNKESNSTKKTGQTGISQFQALCAALAATIGTGNIAGVAAAVVTGGPGAVFWMWVAAFFGMMTNFAENVLGIYFRRRNKDGEWSGGPMYYLKDGLGEHYGKKWLKPIAKVLAGLFACFTILASFGIGNMAQINKIVLNMDAAFFSDISHTIPGTGINTVHLVLGLILLAISAFIILGGIKRIARVAEVVVPFMALVYTIGALVVFAMNIDQVGAMFASIFRFAFTPAAFVGGGIGLLIKKTMTQGFKRGVFSNEAGLGSSVMVHSSSSAKEPVKQGMWGILSVFLDTFVVCTMTAIVVLSTGFINLATGEPAKIVDTTAVIEVVGEENFNNLIGTEELTVEKFSELYATEEFTQMVNAEALAKLAEASKADEMNAELFIKTIDGDTLVSKAFGQAFGEPGAWFVAIAIFFFAFTTVIGWSQYGSKAVEYLFGTTGVKVYKVIFVLMIVSGAVMEGGLAWDLSDTFNGLMMIPNLIGVVALLPLVIRITKNYVDRKIKGKDVAPMLSYDEKIQAEMKATLDED